MKTNNALFSRQSAAGFLGFLAWSFVFAVIYAQSPLYTSNQHQYFLHGLARVGYGYLEHDWLAQTLDPLPLFSALVSLGYRLSPSGLLFYACYALLLGVYLLAALGIVEEVFGRRQDPEWQAVFLILFLILHSALLRYVLSSFLGVPDPFLLEGGVAGQRLLGQVLQPSVFGVFLVLSIYLFLRGHIIPCLLALATAISFHSVYLLTGGLLVLAYVWMTFRSTRSAFAALRIGITSLVLVAPSLAYTLHVFRPTSSRVIAEVNELLVNFRNPHHAIVVEWFGWTVIAKTAIVLAALLVLRRSRLLPILATLAAGSAALTICQLVTDSNTLALLYPWRVSVLLVPLSSCVLVAYALTKALDRLGSIRQHAARWARLLAAVVFTVLIAVGAIRFYVERSRQQTESARPMMGYVAAHASPQDIYLIPPSMEDFRLNAGAAAFVDFKSVPYRDTDVLEWYRRVTLAQWFYRDRIEYVDCGLLERFAAEYGVTHVVLDQPLLELTCPAFGEQLFRNSHYAVVRLRRP